jgi:hypothetical protein
MKCTLILTFFLVAGNAFSQIAESISKRMGADPVLFLDSVETNMNTLQQINPMDISNITIVGRKSAKKQLGNKGADGAVYVITTRFAKECYWKFFCSVSEKYKQLILSPDADSIVRYELNKKPLTGHDIAGSLFWINKKTFKRLEITGSPDSLMKDYIVIIKARRQKGFVNGSGNKK